MFMRYRGGGIGHKYMWEIEAKYENMSRTRSHGKQVHHEPDTPQTDEGRGDEAEGIAPTSTLGSDNDGSNSDESDDEDAQDLSEGSSSSDESVDSDESFDSDEIASEGDYDLYGLVDP